MDSSRQTEQGDLGGNYVMRSIVIASAVVGLSLLSYQARSDTPDKIVWEQAGWQVAAMVNTSGRFSVATL
jgi:hypothetical protein